MGRADQEFFKAAFDRDYPFICRLAQGIVGSVSAAEDVAQETFVRLYRDPPADRANVRGWLATVTVNLALNHLRSERARSRREGDAARSELRLRNTSSLARPAARL